MKERGRRAAANVAVGASKRRARYNVNGARVYAHPRALSVTRASGIFAERLIEDAAREGGNGHMMARAIQIYQRYTHDDGARKIRGIYHAKYDNGESGHVQRR